MFYPMRVDTVLGRMNVETAVSTLAARRESVR